MGAIEFLRKKFSVPGGKTISETVSLPTCWGTIAELLEDFRDYKEPYEPYFGWCEVKGCRARVPVEAQVGGETGYWTTCYVHGAWSRAGEPQPEMKKTAIEREEYRKTQKDGFLKDWDKNRGEMRIENDFIVKKPNGREFVPTIIDFENGQVWEQKGQASENGEWHDIEDVELIKKMKG